MEGYSVKIRDIYGKELSFKERVMLKDTTRAIPLDSAVGEDAPLVIDLDFFAVLDIHNDHTDDKDYPQYVLVDKGGNKYTTGSESLYTSLRDIWEEMQGSDEEYAIEVYRMPSKNYRDKTFFTCSIV